MSRPEPAPVSVWRPMALDMFLRGAPHYPEHVDPSVWDRDAKRLAAAGANVVRMGEFAWHIWEPYEGHFEFELFDRAIEGLAAHGIKLEDGYLLAAVSPCARVVDAGLLPRVADCPTSLLLRRTSVGGLRWYFVSRVPALSVELCIGRLKCIAGVPMQRLLKLC